MANAKITLIGLENFLNSFERSVFDKLRLPDAVNKEILKEAIYLRANEFELLYNDPDFMTEAVSWWGRKHYWTFEKWAKAINLEYEPLWNIDRYEDYSDKHTGSDSRTGTKTSKYTNADVIKTTGDITDTIQNTVETDMSVDTDATTTNSVTGFNSSNFENHDKSVLDQGVDTDGTVKTTGTNKTSSETKTTNDGTNNGTESDTVKGSDEYKNEHLGHFYGNGGVTSSQHLLNEELTIAEWNLYEHIADLFVEEFCIMVY